MNVICVFAFWKNSFIWVLLTWMFTKVNSKDVAQGIRIRKRLLKYPEVCQGIYIYTRQMILTRAVKEEKENLEVSRVIIINQYSMRNKLWKQKTVGNQSKQFHMLPNSIQIYLQTG